MKNIFKFLNKEKTSTKKEIIEQAIFESIGTRDIRFNCNTSFVKIGNSEWIAVEHLNEWLRYHK